MNLYKWYDKNYRRLIIIPAALLAISILYLLFFYFQNGDFINKDVSLTGGTTISIQTKVTQEEMESFLSNKLSDFEVRSISDNSGNQIELAITIIKENEKQLISYLEEFLGFELDSSNSSIESTSESISKDFYRQLIVAVILAFFWMAAVVFIIFSKGAKTKFWVVVLNILFGIFMGKFFFSISPIISGIIFLLITTILIRTYIKNSVPAFAVMLCAFADIVMTLATIDIVGMKLSTAGIVAFLMLIGYSVDTDILLTSRVLGKKGDVNRTIIGAFYTGMTMTLTAIAAVGVALISVYSFGSALNQIFIILLIGLSYDILNTWITNASIIKWYVEKT